MAQINTPARRAMLAARAAKQRARVPRFTPIASRPRLSTRFQPGKPWLTKAWTPCRRKDRKEALEAANG